MFTFFPPTYRGGWSFISYPDLGMESFALDRQNSLTEQIDYFLNRLSRVFSEPMRAEDS